MAMLVRSRSGLWTILIVVYVVVGIVVANSHNYFRGVNELKDYLSVILAIVLWPLVLIGVNLNIK